jgi:hypothetical protein
MSRVLVPSQQRWFSELRAVSYYGESAFERTVRQHVVSVFPDFHVFPFKKTIVHRYDDTIRKKPDLCMIRRDCAAWGIIEVEVIDHDLDHVVEQADCFANGRYNSHEMSEYVYEKLSEHCKHSIGAKRLRTLIGNESPQVLVIVDGQIDGWEEELREIPASLCVFQVYKCPRGTYAYRVHGAYPRVPIREVHCRRHKMLVNTLEIVGDFKFATAKPPLKLNVHFGELITPWVRIEDSGRTYLQFVGKTNPLSEDSTYKLSVDRRGRYYFEVI